MKKGLSMNRRKTSTLPVFPFIYNLLSAGNGIGIVFQFGKQT